MIAKNSGTKKKVGGQPKLFLALIGCLTIILVVFLIFANVRISQRRAELKDRVDSLNKELTALIEQKKKLEEGINQSQSDFYWENKVREQGYKKPGEETIVVLPAEEQKIVADEELKSFWRKLLEKIGWF
ncbi:MAG: septum formation initiator family protein [bacterium]|nr:septum formation initiator family protein [bacterium]